MPSFPTISFSRAAMYPLKRVRTHATSVQSFLGDAETRWVSQLPVSSFLLTFTDVPTADVSTLYTFWTGQGGASTSTFSFTLPANSIGGTSTTYNNLVFDSDTFSKTMSKPNRWTVQIPVRQLRS